MEETNISKPDSQDSGNFLSGEKLPKKKILVLGSDLGQLKSIRNFLEGKGVETSCSVDLQLVEDLVSQENYNFILVDFRMIQEGSGNWLKRTLEMGTQDLPPKILVFVEEKDLEKAQSLSDAGIHRFVVNPGDENLFLQDVYESIKSSEIENVEAPFLSIAELDKKQDLDNKNQQDLMDEIARMSSKLEETLIRETQLRQELEKANRTKDELLSFAAHDLRSPLTTITSAMDFILNPKMDVGPLNDDQVRFLKASRDQAKRLIKMVDELLDFSKIQSGFVELNLASFDPGSLIIEKCQHYSIAAGKKSISLKHDIDENFPNIKGDMTKISSVLDNLIGNAIKFCSADQQVTVCGKVRGDQILVEVQDTGQGLREDELKKVFGAFQKLSARPTAGESSSGLGLAIVKKIVEAHGGSVSVRSEYGKGSVFSFALNIGGAAKA